MELRRSRRLAGMEPERMIEKKGGYSNVTLSLEDESGGSIIPTLLGLCIVSGMYAWAFFS